MATSKSNDLNNRSASADILKSISILAVVVIHGSYLCNFSPSKIDFSISQLDFLMNSLRFCVPVFIFLWAYFTERSNLKKGNSNPISRFYQLLIPFIVWSIVYFFIIADFKQLTISSVISKYWVGYGWAGQYYFIILFQLLVIYSPIRKIVIQIGHYLPLIYIFSILFYAIISYSPWFNISLIGKLGYRPFFYWLPYVMLGIIHAHKNIFPFRVPTIALLLSPAIILAEIYLLKPSIENIYMLPSVFICSLVQLSALQSKLTYSDITPRIGALIQKLANSTLGIFCLNPLVIITVKPLLTRAGFSPSFPGCTIIMPLVSAVFVSIICILIINILKRVRLGLLVAN